MTNKGSRLKMLLTLMVCAAMGIACGAHKGLVPDASTAVSSAGTQPIEWRYPLDSSRYYWEITLYDVQSKTSADVTILGRCNGAELSPCWSVRFEIWNGTTYTPGIDLRVSDSFSGAWGRRESGNRLEAMLSIFEFPFGTYAFMSSWISGEGRFVVKSLSSNEQCIFMSANWSKEAPRISRLTGGCQ